MVAGEHDPARGAGLEPEALDEVQGDAAIQGHGRQGGAPRPGLNHDDLLAGLVDETEHGRQGRRVFRRDLDVADLAHGQGAAAERGGALHSGLQTLENRLVRLGQAEDVLPAGVHKPVLGHVGQHEVEPIERGPVAGVEVDQAGVESPPDDLGDRRLRVPAARGVEVVRGPDEPWLDLDPSCRHDGGTARRRLVYEGAAAESCRVGGVTAVVAHRQNDLGGVLLELRAGACHVLIAQGQVAKDYVPIREIPNGQPPLEPECGLDPELGANLGHQAKPQRAVGVAPANQRDLRHVGGNLDAGDAASGLGVRAAHRTCLLMRGSRRCRVGGATAATPFGKEELAACRALPQPGVALCRVAHSPHNK